MARSSADTHVGLMHIFNARLQKHSRSSSHYFCRMGECTESAQCASLTATPICNTDTMRCVECVADVTCMDSNQSFFDAAQPHCDTASNTCVQCTQNSECTDTSTPTCDVTNTCVA